MWFVFYIYNRNTCLGESGAPRQKMHKRTKVCPFTKQKKQRDKMQTRTENILEFTP